MAKSTRFYGTGRRKSSIARVYLVPGTGKITINKKDMDDYFGLNTLKVIVQQPFAATGTTGKFDVLVNVHGGGFTGFPWICGIFLFFYHISIVLYFPNNS